MEKAQEELNSLIDRMDQIYAREDVKAREDVNQDVKVNEDQRFSPRSEMIHERTILLIGKTGSGKSSVGNAIFSNDKFKVSSALESGTPKGEINTAFQSLNGERYMLRIIDTPGLFDTGNVSNEEVARSIIELIGKDITNINLVCFVINNSKITNEEKETLNILFEKLGDGIKENSCIIITHCEDLLAKQNGIQSMSNKVESSEILKNYREKVNNKIYFVGFPDRKDIIDKDLLKFYERCHGEFRENLLNIIAKAESRVSKFDIEAVVAYLREHLKPKVERGKIEKKIKEVINFEDYTGTGILVGSMIGAVLIIKKFLV